MALVRKVEVTVVSSRSVIVSSIFQETTSLVILRMVLTFRFASNGISVQLTLSLSGFACACKIRTRVNKAEVL